MRYKKAVETTQVYLENTPLPVYGKSYTVISHKNVIDNTKKLLADSGFTIKKEIYRANMNAQVAQGIYHIYPTQSQNDLINNEKELGMMFAWTNSYDKSTRFQCAIGAHVFICGNGMMVGDMMNFKRKHTGSASHDIVVQLSNQIKNGEKHYTRILSDRDALRNTPLSKLNQSELLGRLFVDKEIITSTQISCVKKEINKPSYDYNCNDNNAWTFYNHVTHSLKMSTPKNWMQNSQNFHDFMMVEVNNILSQNKIEGFNITDLETTIDETFDINDVKDIINENNGSIQIDEEITTIQLNYDAYTS
tara:strand:+ start:1345 stop:2259 length:915 start_codon:yes stop_codon:yes gene_type:complete